MFSIIPINYNSGELKSFVIFWQYALVKQSIYITRPKQFKPCNVSTMVGSIVVVGTLTRSWLYIVLNLKTA